MRVAGGLVSALPAQYYLIHWIQCWSAVERQQPFFGYPSVAALEDGAPVVQVWAAWEEQSQMKGCPGL